MSDVEEMFDEHSSLAEASMNGSKRSKKKQSIDDVDFSKTDNRGYPIAAGGSNLTNIRVICSVVVVGGLVLLMLVCTLVVLAGLASFSGLTEQDPELEFYETISLPNIMAHLRNLQDIATLHGGRSVSQGYNASVDYVEAMLAETNYRVWRQEFTLSNTDVVGTPTFEQVAPVAAVYTYDVDYSVVEYSGSGDVTAVVLEVANDGCAAGDYTGALGTAALAHWSGACSLMEMTELAMAANASALLVANTVEQSAPVTGSLGSQAEADPAAITVPVLGVTYVVGLTLGSTAGATVHVDVEMETTELVTMNLLADTADGDEASLMVIGSHLDSKPNVPGINDNGSGAAVNLEVALQYFRAGYSSASKIRFAWWSAEELGLLGSQFYVQSLSPQEVADTVLNINYDMLASPNFFRGVLNGYQADDPIAVSCTRLTQVFEDYYNITNLPYLLTEFNGRSDYGSFLAANITAGGLKTGAEVIKTDAERDLFGGMTNAPFDPCYHLPCDGYENVHPEILAENAEAAAYALQTLASQSDLRSFLGL